MLRPLLKWTACWASFLLVASALAAASAKAVWELAVVFEVLPLGAVFGALAIAAWASIMAGLTVARRVGGRFDAVPPAPPWSGLDDVERHQARELSAFPRGPRARVPAPR